jgi:hypothetical protein
MFLEERDKKTASAMREWQAVGLFLPTTIMSYIDAKRELRGVDFVAGYGREWSEIVVDQSAGLTRFLTSSSRQENVMEAWWADGLAGVVPPDMSQRHKSIAIFNDDCASLDSQYGRQFILDLARQLHTLYDIKVDSYGSCLRNHLTDDSVNIVDSVNVKDPASVFAAMKQYHAVIVLETTRARDYVTEPVYWTLAAGAVPVYYGAPNAADFMPTTDPLHFPCIVDVGLEIRLGLDHVAKTVFGAMGSGYEGYQQWRLLKWKDEVAEGRFGVTGTGSASLPCRVCKWYKNHYSP